MCTYNCELCGGWSNTCKGTHGTIRELEEKVKLRDKKIKFLKEEIIELLGDADISLRGKSPETWTVRQKRIKRGRRWGRFK